MTGLHEDLAVFVVRLLDDFGDREHRSHACVVGGERFGPFVAGLRLESLLERFANLVLHRVVHLRLCVLLEAERLAEVREELGFDRTDRNPFSVTRRIDVIKRIATGEQDFARACDFAGREILIDRKRHQGKHAFGRRHIEEASLAVSTATHQRRHDGHRCVHATACAVRNGGAGNRRPPVFARLGASEKTRHREVVDVVSRPGRSRAVLAVARRRAIDDARVALGNIRVANTKAVDDAGPKALDHDVGILGKPKETFAPAFRLHVDRNVLEPATRAIGMEGRLNLNAALGGERTDLDNSRAVVGECSRRARGRPNAREIEHGNAVE